MNPKAKRFMAVQWIIILGIALLSRILTINTINYRTGDEFFRCFTPLIIVYFCIAATIWAIQTLRRKDKDAS